MGMSFLQRGSSATRASGVHKNLSVFGVVGGAESGTKMDMDVQTVRLQGSL